MLKPFQLLFLFYFRSVLLIPSTILEVRSIHITRSQVVLLPMKILSAQVRETTAFTFYPEVCNVCSSVLNLNLMIYCPTLPTLLRNH